MAGASVIPFYEFTCAKGHEFARRAGYEVARTNCPCGETATRAPFNKPYIHGETVSKGPSGESLFEFASEVDRQYEYVSNETGEYAVRPTVSHASITRARGKMLAEGKFTEAKEKEVTKLEKRALQR